MRNKNVQIEKLLTSGLSHLLLGTYVTRYTVSHPRTL